MGDAGVSDARQRDLVPLRWDATGGTDALRGVLSMYVYDKARTCNGVLCRKYRKAFMTVVVACFLVMEGVGDGCCRSSSWKSRHQHPRIHPIKYRKRLLNEERSSDHLNVKRYK